MKEEATGMELELDLLDLRYERLRRQDARREKRLLASLAEVGQQFPILVVEAGSAKPAARRTDGLADGGDFVVLDGYKRVRALRRLRRETIRAARWEIAEADAVILEGLMRAAGGDSPLEEAWRLRELRERFGLNGPELARRLDKSVSWISRRLALVNALPDAVQDHVRRGEIVAYGAMKFLAPLARANRADCAAIAERIAPLAVTTRQMRELYIAYIESAGEARRRIVENPALFLKAVVDTEMPAAGKSAGKVLFEDLGQLGGVARRLLRRLRDGEARCVRPDVRDDLARCAAEAGRDAGEATARLRKELADAGPGDESGDTEAC